MKQMLFESGGDGGFSGGRKTSEPDGEALLLAELAALLS
jgi:hypothetical protein